MIPAEHFDIIYDFISSFAGFSCDDGTASRVCEASALLLSDTTCQYDAVMPCKYKASPPRRLYRCTYAAPHGRAKYAAALITIYAAAYF